MIGRKFYLITLLMFITAFLNFIALYFITNYLGATIYGQLTWVMATVATINIVVDLGFDSAHVKRVSEGKDIKDSLATYVRIKIFLIIAMVIIATLGVFIWSYVTDSIISNESMYMIFIFVTFYVFLDVSNIVMLTFVGRNEMARYAVIGIIDPIIRVPLVILLAINHASIVLIAFAMLLGSIGMCIAAIIVLRRSGIRLGKPTLLKSYYVFAIPVSIISIINILSMNLDKIMIGLFSTITDVGLYSSSLALISVVAILGSAVSSVSFPIFSKLHAEGKVIEIKETSMKAERYLAFISLPVLIFIIFFAEPIVLTFFGPEFESSVIALQLLAVSCSISILNQIYFCQINAFNLPRTNAKIMMLWFLVFVILLTILIPDELLGIQLFGLSFVGACIASIIANLTVFFILRMIVLKLSGTGFNLTIVLYIALALSVNLILLSMTPFFSDQGFVNLVVYGLISLTFYLILSLVTRLINKEDLIFFIDVINLRSLWRYIASEFK